MTSPDDPLDAILSAIAAADQVDPAVFDQTLDAAFEYSGTGFDELIPDTDSSATGTDDGDALLVGDHHDTFYMEGSADEVEADQTDIVDHSDTDSGYSAGDDFLT